ncbi:hypothetical protein QTP81_06645 [Alteromonas sp. ASW11-36]|uniref:Uncharacterized protein n=1 Tax=Alteromonas arenosi TaxID=3055817 RepID=A0ABT7SVS5_9ALTE|nr:hypothetical protein [Alteromonas sp. ASW11-36]MDM7860268.1 hypothetical protein [Alteromonas sp. ASW11-36]
MSNDLLFSVLPRRGTVPVKSDRGEVKKVDKKSALHPSPQDENHPVIQEKPDRQEQQPDQQSKDYSDEHIGLIVDTTDENVEADEQEIVHNKQEFLDENSVSHTEDDDPDKDDRVHLDITV